MIYKTRHTKKQRYDGPEVMVILLLHEMTVN